MRRFFRLIIALVILAVLVMGSMYIAGNVAENRFRMAMALINEIPGTTSQIISYKRKLFKSEANVMLTIAGAPYAVNSKIYHGPIVFKKRDANSIPVQFVLAYVNNQVGAKSLSYPITWSMSFPYSGGADIWSKGTEHSVTQEAMIVKTSGWEALGKISRPWDSYTFDSNSNYFTILNKFDQKVMFDIQGINFHTDYQLSNKVKTSNVLYSFSKILAPLQGFELTKPTFRIELINHPETLDSLFAIKIENLVLMVPEDMGTQNTITLGPEQATLKVENIDSQALHLFARYSEKGLNQAQLMEVINKILKRKPRIFLENTEFNLPNGKILAEAKFTLGGEETVENLTINDILKTLDGEINAKVTKTLFKEVALQMQVQSLSNDPKIKAMPEEEKQKLFTDAQDKFMESLTKEGILTDEGDMVAIKAIFVKGQWVSGQDPSLSSPTSNAPELPESSSRTKIPKELDPEAP